MLIYTLKEQNYITEELPEHGETVLTYTPTTEMAEEQVRLIKYGSLKSGFPWLR